MKGQTHMFLWAIVGALLMTWLLSYAAIQLTNAEHNPTVYHYAKVCRPQSPQGRP